MFFNDYFRLPVVIVRYFNSYGPGEYPGKYRNVIPNYMDRAFKNQPLIITGTGNETRAFTFVDDIVQGTIKAAYSKKYGQVFNIGNSVSTKIKTLAKTINSITGNTAGIQYIAKRKWDKTQSKQCSISKASKILKYIPKTDLDEGLQKTYEWFLKCADKSGRRK